MEVDGLNIGEAEKRKQEWLELQKLIEIKDHIRFQQARSRWVKEGDTNSSFFHKCVERKREIQGDGRWLDDVKEVKEGVCEYFSNKFAKKSSTYSTFPVVLQGFSLEPGKASSLEADFLEEEVKAAVWDCGLDKSPGPDGFNFSFFREFWSVIKGDIMAMFREFQDNGKLVRGLNSSFITLIPKCANPLSMDEFRPISLIGGVYKILAKVLAKRFAPMLDEIISVNQSAFVGDRNILDSVVIANEVVDEARKKKKKIFLFKIDFEKAFDTVDWKFLLDMLKVLGCGEKWCRWIEECISTAESSVLFNGSPSNVFKMGRGLRQGDPLSPFLFLAIAEGLSRMISVACKNGKFNPVKVGKEELEVSHLQFADDSIIFGDANEMNIETLKSILRCFEWHSGLKINFQKSCLYGIGVDATRLDSWANFLNCLVGKLPFIYLGLPIGARPSDKKVWQTVVDRVENKLKTWENHFLSLGGRVVLTKAVLTSIPIYYLSFFKLPKFVLNRLKSIQCQFLWVGLLGGKKRVAWVKWEEICKSKECGGLGIKDIEGFNEALLGKWLWRLLENRDALWSKVLFSKYGNFLEAVFQCRGGKTWDKSWSSWWRDLVRLLGCREWFWEGLFRVVGNGSSTNFWTMNWLGSGLRLCELFPRLYSLELVKDSKISDRVRVEEGVVVGAWAWRRRLFAWEEDLLADLLILLNRYNFNGRTEDKWLWKFAKDGNYSVRDGYNQVMREKVSGSGLLKVWSKLVWNRWAPTKINCFMWRLVLDRLPTRPNLMKRNILCQEEAVSCVLCEDGVEESVEHLFFQCKFASYIWKLVEHWMGIELIFSDSAVGSLDMFAKLVPGKWREVWMIIWHGVCWYIWKARNARIFVGNTCSHFETFEILKFNIWSWLKEKDVVFAAYTYSDWDRFPSKVLNLAFVRGSERREDLETQQL